METISQIWDGDLFKRQEEAKDLIGYLESVAQRPQIRDEGHAHVLAVDTAYGQGKSFFLRRLARLNRGELPSLRLLADVLAFGSWLQQSE